MSNDYNDIDFCLQLLYEYAYGTSNKCFELRYESKKDVDMILLKKDSSFDPTPILKENIMYDHTNGDKIIFKRTSNSGYPSLLRISKYDKDEKVASMSNSKMIDIKLNYILSEL